MKLSKQTIQILRNLAGINTNLLIKPGNRLLTVNPSKTVFGCVDVEESFDTQFGIYDLSELLGVLSIFNEPELNFNGSGVLTIEEGKNRIRYMSADPEVLIYPKREPRFQEPDLEFKLSGQQLGQIIKSASILKVPFITIQGDGSNVVVLVHDKSNPNSNQFRIDVDATTEHVFELHLKVDNLKMIHEDYTVQVSFNKILKFVGNDKFYILTCELDSSIG